jgi:hypothetical protein
MNAASPADNQACKTALREAIAARNEPLYQQKLMQFLVTREGFVFVEDLMHRQAALAVMRRSFHALAAPLGLSHPDDLVSWLRNDEAAPRPAEPGAKDVVSMALPYFRFARGWARAAHKESSYAVALAMLFFEPVLGLCEGPGDSSKPGRDSTAAANPPTFAQITQRA